ncbi:MAG TPA: HEAT repeat domain-containing protein [Thermoanaerobaculia bacterium]|nr:HEAT repeat domain-containing protein [Thermoanaerobaculia bacterium]
MTYRKVLSLAGIIVIPALLLSPASAAAFPPPEPGAADAPYEKGKEALDAGKWEQALGAFREIVRDKGPKADAATYWIAYAQNKLGRSAEALATLADLKRQYAKSPWLKDARALEAEIRPDSRVVSEADGDEELKLMAINGLMTSDPERALPLLEKLLRSNQSTALKERALFVLAQSKAPRAHGILLSTAQGTTNPELQEKAIRYLGMIGAREDLATLYRTATSREIKRSVIKSMMLGGDSEHLAELAKGEKDPELRGEAIQKLGMIGKEKTAALLRDIYRSDPDRSVKKRVLQAYFLQDNVHALLEIARGEKDRELKTEAVKKLSLMQSKEATDYMMEILEK